MTVDTAALRELLGKATKGPWFVGAMNDALFIIDQQPSPAPIDHVFPERHKDAVVIAKLDPGTVQAVHDSSLLVAAVNALPALLDEVEGMRGELQRLYQGYVNMLELGRDRIIALGGTCDPVDVMEEGDPVLRSARAALGRSTPGK